jgi:hypothetical protein
MAVWYSLGSFVTFFPIWNVWTKKNLATLLLSSETFQCHYLPFKSKRKTVGKLSSANTSELLAVPRIEEFLDLEIKPFFIPKYQGTLIKQGN